MGRNGVLKLNGSLSNLKTEFNFPFLDQFNTADIAPLAFSDLTVFGQYIGNKLLDLISLGNCCVV